MVFQSNNTPLVRLGLIVICMAVGIGAFLAGLPIGPSQDVRDEAARVDIRATEAALGALQTPQAIFAAQTAVAAELTSIPPVQTTTAIAAERNFNDAQRMATQTKMAQDASLDRIAAAATATSIARESLKQNAVDNAGIGFLVVGALMLCVWLVERMIVSALRVRADHQLAQANSYWNNGN
ncbi:MAG: hypothetical protein QM730_14265 [Anaerolineales bacterium]